MITSGGYGLPDGTQVKIEKPGEEGKEGAGEADDEKKDSKEGGDDKKDKNDEKKKASGGSKSAGSEKE